MFKTFSTIELRNDGINFYKIRLTIFIVLTMNVQRRGLIKP